MDFFKSGIFSVLIKTRKTREIIGQLKSHSRLEFHAQTGQIPPTNTLPPLTLSQIITLSQDLLTNHKNELSLAEYAQFAEMLIIAYLQYTTTSPPKVKHENVGKAEKLLEELKGKVVPFSKVRIGRLIGMIHESKGEFEQALDIYSHLMETEDECASSLWKRMICVYECMGSMDECIRQLESYLGVFMNDVEAWEHLADLYLSSISTAATTATTSDTRPTSNIDLEKALFCLEEILILRPYHVGYILKYAQVMFKLQTIDAVLISRKYFCLACKYSNDMSIDCIEGLRGILDCNSHLRNSTDLSQQQKKVVDVDIIDQLDILINSHLNK